MRRYRYLSSEEIEQKEQQQRKESYIQNVLKKIDQLQNATQPTNVTKLKSEAEYWNLASDSEAK